MRKRKAQTNDSSIESEQDPDESGVSSVVLIEPRDDIGAICGRVDSARNFAVVVHAPKGNRVLATELGMRRLKRHGEESGHVIAIATRSGTVRARARQCRIPVARRPENVRWDSAGKKVFRVGRRSVLLPAFSGLGQFVAIVAVLAVLALGALTVGPSSTVTITPPVERLSQSVLVTADPGRAEIDFNQLLVPARSVSGTQTLTLAVPTTGKAVVPVQRAHVAVTITNTGAAEVTVPAHAVLLGSNVQFELDQAVTLPPAKSIPGAATAVLAGKAGNVAPGTVTAWRDAAYRALTVTNAAAAQGGTDEERPAVDANDLSALNVLVAQMEKSESLRAKVLADRPHDAIFLQTATSTVTSGEPSSPAGTVADVVFIDVRVTASAMAVPAETLEALARGVLAKDRGAIELVPGSVVAAESGARATIADSGSVRTQLELSGEFVRDITRDGIRDAVKGKSSDDARSTLADRYGIQDATVDLTPGWAPWLPRFNFRIDVEYRRPAADSAAAGTPEAASINARTPTATPAASRP